MTKYKIFVFKIISKLNSSIVYNLNISIKFVLDNNSPAANSISSNYR